MERLKPETAKPTNPLALFDSLKAEVTVFVEPCLKIAVQSQETCEAALQAVSQVKSFSKRIEERRQQLVKPLNDQVKLINNYAKGITEPLETAESHIKFELIQWERKLEKERQEAMLKAQEEKRKAEAEARAKAEAEMAEAEAVAAFMPEDEAVKVQMDAQVNAELGVMQVQFEHKVKIAEISEQKVKGVRRPWTFEVSDSTIIPDKYMMVNEKAVREAIRAGVREIPGIRIYQETTIAIGGR